MVKRIEEINVTVPVIVQNVGGDLVLRGREGGELVVDGDSPQVEHLGSGQPYLVRCAGDCRMFVPPTVDVVVQQDAAQPISVAGDVSKLSGKCPTVTFAVDERSVYTSGATMYVGGSCQKLKNRQHIETLGLPRTDGGLEALTVTFDADLLQ